MAIQRNSSRHAQFFRELFRLAWHLASGANLGTDFVGSQRSACPLPFFAATYAITADKSKISANSLIIQLNGYLVELFPSALRI